MRGLRDRLLDALIVGEIGHGIVVTRQEFIKHFSDVGVGYTGVFLANSEITTGLPHNPNYKHFTLRIKRGTYQIHPKAILDRMKRLNLT
jgi:hypothetical protein